MKEFTWQQVSVHTTKNDCWVIDNRKVYDITEFVDKHPGGRDLLLLGAGRDITNLLTSYHWWTSNPRKILSKYQIGTLTGDNEFPSFKPDSGFYQDLCQKVSEYFKETGKDPKDPLPGLARLVLMLTISFMSYYVMFVWPFASWNMRIIASIVFGMFQALPLLHQMHDASHTAIGHGHTTYWLISTLTMDLFAGASINSWHHQHVLSHHLYTNCVQVDADLPVRKDGDLRRIANFQSWSFMYKLQFLYLPIVYTLLTFKFRIQDIVNTLIDKSNGALRVTNVNTYHIAEQILVKIWFVFWRIVYPMYWLNVPAKEVAVLFVISEVITGAYLTWNFQVSHVSPVADFYDLSPEIKDEWAVVQVLGSVDYAHNNPITTFLSGALNYQTVHHLFPAISQYHYPALAPIVMDVAKKYNVRYNLLPNFYSAFKQHLIHLKNMGGDPMVKRKVN